VGVQRNRRARDAAEQMLKDFEAKAAGLGETIGQGKALSNV
jgi:hypothetical protein